MKHALVFAFAALGCAGAEPVTIAPAQPAAPVAEVNLEARPAPQPSAQPAPPSTAQPQDAPPTALTPEQQKEAAQYGMIGLLSAGGSGEEGMMVGGQIGDSFGVGGLGLSGTGGQGTGTIGLGSIGARGGQGFGGGRSKPPKIEVGAANVAGRLPPDVIKRIVKQHFGRFRLCYENGLRNNPKLAGKVVVKFVIGRDGAVTNVANEGSTTMPDAGVVSCIARSFQGLSFPQPEGGIVVVTYPIDMHPPEAAPPAPPPPPPAKKP